MVNADAIKEIRNGQKSEVVDINGQKFHQTDKELDLVEFNTEKPLNVYSLSQVVSLIQETDIPEEDGLLVNVYSYNKVSVVRKKKDLNLDNVEVCHADFSGEFRPFEPDQKFTQEEFIIRLQSRFVHTPELAVLLSLVSKISGGKTSETTDNGYSQTASVKSGVHIVSDDLQPIKSIWDLNPYKSFPEIEPVTVPHILRLHNSAREDQPPMFALYEADGGMWKVKTTQAIKVWLSAQLKELANVKVL